MIQECHVVLVILSLTPQQDFPQSSFFFLHQEDPATGPRNSYRKFRTVSPPRGESPKTLVLQSRSLFSALSFSQNFQSLLELQNFIFLLSAVLLVSPYSCSAHKSSTLNTFNQFVKHIGILLKENYTHMTAENNCVNDSPEFLSVLVLVFLTSILNKQIVQDPTSTETFRRKENKENVLF